MFFIVFKVLPVRTPYCSNNERLFPWTQSKCSISVALIWTRPCVHILNASGVHILNTFVLNMFRYRTCMCSEITWSVKIMNTTRLNMFTYRTCYEHANVKKLNGWRVQYLLQKRCSTGVQTVNTCFYSVGGLCHTTF